MSSSNQPKSNNGDNNNPKTIDIRRTSNPKANPPTTIPVHPAPFVATPPMPSEGVSVTFVPLPGAVPPMSTPPEGPAKGPSKGPGQAP